MGWPKRHIGCLCAAQKLLCASELGLSCPSSGGRHLTHVAALSARFHSVVSTRHLRCDVRNRTDFVCFALSFGHSGRDVRFRTDFVCFTPDFGHNRRLSCTGSFDPLRTPTPRFTTSAYDPEQYPVPLSIVLLEWSASAKFENQHAYRVRRRYCS